MHVRSSSCQLSNPWSIASGLAAQRHLIASEVKWALWLEQIELSRYDGPYPQVTVNRTRNKMVDLTPSLPPLLRLPCCCRRCALTSAMGCPPVAQNPENTAFVQLMDQFQSLETSVGG